MSLLLLFRPSEGEVASIATAGTIGRANVSDQLSRVRPRTETPLERTRRLEREALIKAAHDELQRILAAMLREDDELWRFFL